MERKSPTIFISHRHDDKPIADVISSALRTLGNGQLRIYQSSEMRENTSTIGLELTNTQKKALSDTDVVILIYTVTDQDWYYCLWQCGLATNTSEQETEMVVFQCANDIPASLRDLMCVTLDECSLKGFIYRFYRDPAFIQVFAESFVSDVGEEKMDAISHDLFNKLRRVV